MQQQHAIQHGQWLLKRVRNVEAADPQLRYLKNRVNEVAQRIVDASRAYASPMEIRRLMDAQEKANRALAKRAEGQRSH